MDFRRAPESTHFEDRTGQDLSALIEVLLSRGIGHSAKPVKTQSPMYGTSKPIINAGDSGRKGVVDWDALANILLSPPDSEQGLTPEEMKTINEYLKRRSK